MKFLPIVLLLAACASRPPVAQIPAEPDAPKSAPPVAAAVMDAEAAEREADHYKALSLTASRGDILYAIELSEELHGAVVRLSHHRTKANAAAVKGAARALRQAVRQ